MRSIPDGAGGGLIERFSTRRLGELRAFETKDVCKVASSDANQKRRPLGAHLIRQECGPCAAMAMARSDPSSRLPSKRKKLSQSVAADVRRGSFAIDESAHDQL
jgi:hypothetical protein